MSIKLIIDKEEMRAQILREVYNQSGHKEKESTYHRLSQRYFWNSSYKDVKDYIKSCLKCQLRLTQREEEALYPIASNRLIEK